MIQNQQLVHQTIDVAQNMGTEQDGLALVFQALYQGDNFFPAQGIQAAHGFVQNQELRVVEQRQNKVGPLLHALGIVAQAFPPGLPQVEFSNFYDYAARVAEAQNKALSSVTGSVVSGAVIGTGIVAGANVLKSALNNAGSHVNTTMQGDNNSHTTYETQSHVDNNVGAGDNSPISIRNPPVSGPDLSTTTVHEAPAAPTP